VPADDVKHQARPATLGPVGRSATGGVGKHGERVGDARLTMAEAEILKDGPAGQRAGPLFEAAGLGRQADPGQQPAGRA
jgi:hypothetical protein